MAQRVEWRSRRRLWMLPSCVRLLLTAAFTLNAFAADVITVWGDQSQGQGSLPGNVTDVVAISAGAKHELAVTTDGSVLAWGANTAGQTDVPILRRRAFAVAAGQDFSLALLDNGTVQAWGANDHSQCDVPDGLAHVIAIAAGGQHALALLSDGTVWAWGSNDHGESSPPGGLTGVIAIAVGQQHCLALRDNGTVVAWGDDTSGQCTLPSGLAHVIAIAAGDAHSVALHVDGTVVTWGDNSSGQSTVPNGLALVKSISAGSQQTAALRVDGSVAIWGDNTFGELSASSATGVIAVTVGTGSILTMTGDQRSIASFGFNAGTGTPPTQTGVIGVECSNGGVSGVALLSQGTMLSFGQWVNNEPPPATLVNLKHLSAGYWFAAGLGVDGTAVVSHMNGGLTLMDPPADIIGKVRSLDAGSGDGLIAAILDDGTVRAWGTNYAQQIDVPTGLSGVKAICSGYWGSVALTSGGAVVPWGYADPYYNLMDVPAGLSGVKQVEDGTIFRMALKDDGTVVVWGRDEWHNISGMPPDLDGVIAISAGYYLCYALKSDGTVATWGGEIPPPTAPSSVAATAKPLMLIASAPAQPVVDGIVSFSGGKDSWTAVTAGASVPRLTISPANRATNQYPIIFTLSFSQAVSGLQANTISVSGGTAGALSQINASTYHFAVSPISSLVTVTVPDGMAHNLRGTLATGCSASVVSDRIPPVITVTPAGGDLGTLPAILTLSVNEPVALADATRLAATWGTISTVTQVSPTSVTLDFVPSTSTSVLTCASGLVTDPAGNSNAIASATYTVSNPSVILSGPGDKVSGTPFIVQATFSTPVSGFTDGDILATHATLGPVSGSGATFTIQVTPIDTSPVVISVPLGAAVDSSAKPSLPQSLTVSEHTNPGSSTSSSGGGSCGVGGLGLILAGLGLFGFRHRRQFWR